MTTEEQGNVVAFCELVRRMMMQINRLCMVGDVEEAAGTALLVCAEQAKFKRQILGIPEPPHVDMDHDRLSLAALSTATPSPVQE